MEEEEEEEREDLGTMTKELFRYHVIGVFLKQNPHFSIFVVVVGVCFLTSSHLRCGTKQFLKSPVLSSLVL